MKSQLLWVAFLLVACISALYCVNSLAAARRNYRESSSELAECERLASQIARLNARPRLASLNLDSPQQVISQVSEAMNNAALPAASLISISPSMPLRFRSTNYQQRTTELSFASISLVKLAIFATEVTRSNDGSYVRDIVITNGTQRATTNREFGEAAEVWNVRLVLTQIIYSPTSQ